MLFNRRLIHVQATGDLPKTACAFTYRGPACTSHPELVIYDLSQNEIPSIRAEQKGGLKAAHRLICFALTALQSWWWSSWLIQSTANNNPLCGFIYILLCSIGTFLPNSLCTTDHSSCRSNDGMRLWNKTLVFWIKRQAGHNEPIIPQLLNTWMQW